jgi:hypothetical protein
MSTTIKKPTLRRVDFTKIMTNPAVQNLMNDAMAKPVNTKADDAEVLRMNSEVPLKLSTILFEVYQTYRMLKSPGTASVWPTQMVVRAGDDGNKMLVDTGIPLVLARASSRESIHYGRWYFNKAWLPQTSEGPRRQPTFAGWVDLHHPFMDVMQLLCGPDIYHMFTMWKSIAPNEYFKYHPDFKEDLWKAADGIMDGSVKLGELTFLALQCREVLSASEAETDDEASVEVSH